MSSARVKKVLAEVKGKVTVRNFYLLYNELNELIKNCQKNGDWGLGDRKSVV